MVKRRKNRMHTRDYSRYVADFQRRLKAVSREMVPHIASTKEVLGAYHFRQDSVCPLSRDAQVLRSTFPLRFRNSGRNGNVTFHGNRGGFRANVETIPAAAAFFVV